MEPATIAVLVMTVVAAAIVGWMAVKSHKQPANTDKPSEPAAPDSAAPETSRQRKRD